MTKNEIHKQLEDEAQWQPTTQTSLSLLKHAHLQKKKVLRTRRITNICLIFFGCLFTFSYLQFENSQSTQIQLEVEQLANMLNELDHTNEEIISSIESSFDTTEFYP